MILKVGRLIKKDKTLQQLQNCAITNLVAYFFRKKKVWGKQKKERVKLFYILLINS